MAYVNRSLPDTELDGFVDTLARRIARFDKQAIAAIKRLVNIRACQRMRKSLGWDAFISSVRRPQAQEDIRKLMGPRAAEKSGRRAAARGVHRQTRRLREMSMFARCMGITRGYAQAHSLIFNPIVPCICSRPRHSPSRRRRDDACAASYAGV